MLVCYLCCFSFIAKLDFVQEPRSKPTSNNQGEFKSKLKVLLHEKTQAERFVCNSKVVHKIVSH